MGKRKGFFAANHKRPNTAVRRVIKAIRDWYDGELVDIGGPFIGFYHRYHWTASTARVLVEFWLRHWKWIIGSGAAFVAWVLTFKT
jgi:hypothetical protein